MCGIFCTINYGTAITLDNLKRIKRRGPDSWNCQNIKLGKCIQIILANSILHLRGDRMNSNPPSDSQSYLLWNGEIFGGIEVPPNINDTEILNDLFNSDSSEENIINILCKINGPWAFIYLQVKEEKLWFGRDVFGRRSLLWTFNDDKIFKLSSVAENDDDEWFEVPANGIFYLDLKNFTEKTRLIHFPWQNHSQSEFHHFNIELDTKNNIKNPISNTLNKQLPNEIDLTIYPYSLVQNFIDVLRQSIKTRVENQQKCKNCSTTNCPHCKIGILFSGGIDSSVIARITDEFVPQSESIDLLNVAFIKDNVDNACNVPDRISGKMALEELKKINPNRNWNLVEINITADELREWRSNTISALIYPSNTVLDDSIGCSIWFAARGIDRDYVSPCKVLLVGMGADEQLAGYSRHRVRFINKSWEGLIEEIEMEISRISWRNLGRDDRVIADHGREARFPFLDEKVVEFLNDVPIWVKANLNLQRGCGEKLLLRHAAKMLGFDRVSGFAKRAIQFGTRIAKIENLKQNGHDVMVNTL